jgi:hypothetical protein
VVQTGPRTVKVRVDAPAQSRASPARVRAALSAFLSRQGLAGVTARVSTGRVDAHPISGKFRQVWREKAPHP